MKKIFLSNGQVSLVSDEDYLYLAGFNWCLNRKDGYVYGRINNKSQLMHHVILERMEIDRGGKVTDHINGNKSDNRRSNLRVITPSQNSMNACRSRNNKSGFKGVSWSKEKQKWQAQIQINNEKIHLGYFDIPEEAYAVYCSAASQYFGKFARIG